MRTAVRAAGFDTPTVVAGGIYGFDQAEAILAARRSRHRRRRAPVARRSRLVPEDAPRPRRRGPPLRVHQLLRGARSAPQAGHVQAVYSSTANDITINGRIRQGVHIETVSVRRISANKL